MTCATSDVVVTGTTDPLEIAAVLALVGAVGAAADAARHASDADGRRGSGYAQWRRQRIATLRATTTTPR